MQNSLEVVFEMANKIENLDAGSGNSLEVFVETEPDNLSKIPPTSLTNVERQADSSNEVSNKTFSIEKKHESVFSNVEKGRFLEYSNRKALEKVGLPFQDTSHECNVLLDEEERHIPDFITPKEVFEDKNWNCKRYGIDEQKCLEEIQPRFFEHSNKRKILIISNPRPYRPKQWIRTKRWLKACGVRILELGYFVDVNHISQAINDIVTWLRKEMGVCTPILSNRFNLLSSFHPNTLLDGGSSFNLRDFIDYLCSSWMFYPSDRPKLWGRYAHT